MARWGTGERILLCVMDFLQMLLGLVYSNILNMGSMVGYFALKTPLKMRLTQKTRRLFIFPSISRYFPLWGYWTGRYFPGNTAWEIPPWYFPDIPAINTRICCVRCRLQNVNGGHSGTLAFYFCQFWGACLQVTRACRQYYLWSIFI